MSVARYAEWLARGRAHQAEDRPVDALLCYRRALRELTGGVDAWFHIGEVSWQLGNPDDAIAAWRKACESAPGHARSCHALAEAHAAAGELDASEAAARRAMALLPSEGRAAMLAALLVVARGGGSVESLANTLSAKDPWPLALLAQVIEQVLGKGLQGDRQTLEPRETADHIPALIEAAAAAGVSRMNEDALRRIGFALALAGPAYAEAAQAFADRYGAACKAFHRARTPLLWPRRTAGNRVRVGVLAGADPSADAVRVGETLGHGGLGLYPCTWFALAGAAHPQSFAAGELRVLPSNADIAARVIAGCDLDVLIDLGGVGHPSGPLLALRPARAIWAIEQTGLPLLRVLADRVLPFEDAAGELEVFQASIDRVPSGPLPADELGARFEEAVRAHQRGDAEAARVGYETVLADQPQHAPTLYLAGVLARDHRTQGHPSRPGEGDDRAAVRAQFRAAVEAAPTYVDARVALVDALTADGFVDEAARVAREGVGLTPDVAALWSALGDAELKRGDGAAAAAAFDQALRLDPVNGQTHYNHGVALQMMGRSSDAARAYQRALALRPDLHAADFNLGVIFEEQGNVDAAIAAYASVLRQVPTHAAAYKARSDLLLASGRIDAWYANFEQFEKNCPGHLMLAVEAVEVCAYRADFAKLNQYLDGLRTDAFAGGEPLAVLDALQQLLYLLLFFDVEPELVHRYAGVHDALARKVYGEPWPRRESRRPGRIRIGYLSGDFRNHVMGKMMWHALVHHDAARFEVFGYSTNASRDEWTDRFVPLFSRLESLVDTSDHEAARRIAEDDLDVLVDLSTHTKHARPGILALRPARVQITHVASAGTLAMSAVDFKLTDRYADVEGDPELRIEAQLPMEGCVYPYRHIAPSDEVQFTRPAAGIAGDAIVIGAFVTPLKLSQRCLALWREVLARVPKAVLAFSPIHPGLRGVFRGIAAVAGIDANRIAFLPQGRNDAENQARYRIIDFVLDPMPYGGVNGTLEALDMGVPVVTLVGKRHGERSSYSILVNLGVTDTIAHSGRDYVGLAVRLATEPAFMGEVRRQIAAGLRQSALTDMVSHTRNLEAAYVRALESRITGFAPE
ncbi:MAG: tetratricopeptide repeat protein [Betaproteobacteria bacterium]